MYAVAFERALCARPRRHITHARFFRPAYLTAFVALIALGSAFARSNANDEPQVAINSAGVVNAANYGGTVAPGSIAAVFGSFPPAAPAVAPAAPLPTVLSQLSLQFAGGTLAPLYFVSSTQANIQIPWELPVQANTTVSAIANGQSGDAQPVAVAPFAPGIFSMNGQGTGQGAVQDSSYRLVDSSHPVSAGQTVTIYCTGLGAVTNQPSTGSVALSQPLSSTTETPTVTIGGSGAEVLFSGLAPGSVGLYQVNAVVPAGSAIGDAVSVVIAIGGVTSNTVTIAVRPNSDQLAAALVAQMTLDEKLQLVHGGVTASNSVVPRGAAGWVPGIARLGIPDLYLVDGSAGVGNGVGPATALPSSITSAATWDLDSAYKYGHVIGAEMRAYGVNVNLGGNVNLNREPRNGRTFETKGEDPILAGRINAAHIRAIQDQHLIGGMKHFALNDQETGRTLADVLIDGRSERESDLLAFEITLKDSNVQSVMCSYNLVGGTYACENAHLLNDVLKGDWGFQGFVMSDWWATHSTAAAANAGLDQEQPNDPFFADLKTAVTAGQVPQARLDDMVRRILRAMFEVGVIDHPAEPGAVDQAAGEAVAQDVLEQGAVLLKNAGGQLPLSARSLRSIAVIGSHADIGVLSGGGSAQVWPTGGPALVEGTPCPPCWSQVVWDPSSPVKAIQAQASNAVVRFADGTNAPAAAALAASSDVAIVFVSQWASEGMDLPSLSFTDVIHPKPVDQNAVVTAVAAANSHTIVVLENGGAQAMPWLGNVSAVLEAWYPGQRGGEAIANLLFGVVNPSGKLPVTFPASAADLPHPLIAAPPNGSTTFPVDYSEGLHAGYKWYDANRITPLFPFGFGLSYTTFSFSSIELADNLSSGNPNFQVAFDLTNTGMVPGAEVAQVYLAFPSGMGEPPRRLVGWRKVFLQPGETQRITVQVNRNDSSHPVSYWDVAANAWRVAAGDYGVYVGNSSAASDLVLSGTLHIAR